MPLAFLAALLENSSDLISTFTVSPTLQYGLIFLASAKSISLPYGIFNFWLFLISSVVSPGVSSSTTVLTAYMWKSPVILSSETSQLSTVLNCCLNSSRNDFSIVSSITSLLIPFSFSNASSADINSLLIVSSFAC